MATYTNLNLCVLPLNIMDDISFQKCILPKEVYDAYDLRAGTWWRCRIKGAFTGYTLCQIYPRDIEPKYCYMDNCVGTISEIAGSHLIGLESIGDKIKLVRTVDITLAITNDFFKGRLRKMSANMLAVTAKQCLAALHLSIGCVIRNAEARMLGITAIIIDACDEAEGNDIFLLDVSANINIKNFHMETNCNVSDTTPFIKCGYELAWNDMEELLTATKLRHIHNHIKTIRPHLNVLLIGPPGCGKTTMLNAFVAEHNFNCFYITTNGVLQQYPGEAESELRKVFDNALHLHLQLKAKDPTVIIIENLELFCPSVKSFTTDAAYSNRICTQLVNLLDELHNSTAGIFCISTTSDPLCINSIARRPGRFQHEVIIDCPNEEKRKMIFKEMYELSQRKFFSDKLKLYPQILDFVGKRTQGFVAGDLALLVQNIERQQLRKKREENVLNLVKYALNEVKPASVLAADVTVNKSTHGFEFIGGMDSLKRILNVSVLAGLRQNNLYKYFGLKLPKGLLLYGPAGCAKTTFAKCLAKEANMTFIATSGAEVYSPYVGCAEKFISKIFDTARKNAPCLIFFDEIDTLAGRRPIVSNSSNDVHVRILSTLLTEMDGVIDSSDNIDQQILVVAASNRPDMVDEALLRPGRLSKHIYVPPPDLRSRIAILELLAKRMPFAEDVNSINIAKASESYTGADMCNLCNEAALIAYQRIDDTNGKCEIVASDFVTALKITNTSLSKAQMDIYKKFQRKIQSK